MIKKKGKGKTTEKKKKKYYENQVMPRGSHLPEKENKRRNLRSEYYEYSYITVNIKF
jgi:hypothetical protein